MRIPLVLHNLADQKLRTCLAITGVGFSILLIFMQLGFYGSAEATATLFLDSMEYDLILISSDYMDINRPSTFPSERLYQLKGDEDVVGIAPIYVSAHYWRIVKESNHPSEREGHGLKRAIMVVGFHIDDPIFRSDQLRKEKRKLTEEFTVLMDNRTRDYFGDRHLGVETELGDETVRIVGHFTIGTGYGADGMVLVSDDTYQEIFPFLSLKQINLGLVRLKPGADTKKVARRLQYHLDQDQLYRSVRVLTREQILAEERDFWLNQTSVGNIFTIGVIVALIVGTVFVYQVLSTDIANRFPEYATLKAIGYPDRYLSWLVIQQAVIYAFLGFIPGCLAALALYGVASDLANLPIGMTVARMITVGCLAIAMCTVSAMFALRKVQKADPADLF